MPERTSPGPSSFFHKLRHLFSYQHGHVVSITVEGQNWIAFQCSTCGDISSLTEPHGPSWLRSQNRPSYSHEGGREEDLNA